MIQQMTDRTIWVSVPDFDPDAVFENGQCFRWKKQEDGSWTGIAFHRELTLHKQQDGLLLSGTTASEFETIWRQYFDLDRDYTTIRSTFMKDGPLARAVLSSPGLRLLRQEPWEALCSFIFSQNNNIPRIKGIIDRLCTHFGEKLPGGGFSFPSPATLSICNEEDLAPLRCGFRAKYVLDAARKVSSGAIDLNALSSIPLDEARSILQTIHGVGPKVAECALLFGCGRIDCFPIDVWVRRILAAYYPEGFPKELQAFGGIAQQFLFHYERNHATHSQRARSTTPRRKCL
ncbi:MAG TPA: 8-oxoguanine DNA glycosylase [Ruminococcaceae bacterium]|nr:8-oxoguanine DNA glycosylase [Oscillospiraceae bacterium]